MSEQNWKISDDRKTVTITFATEPPVDLTFNTADLEQVIHSFGVFRVNMEPEVKREINIPPGQKLEAVPDPMWVTEPDALLGNSILHLRDPRFGWLHYVLPREESKKLGELLIKQATSPAPGETASGRAN